MMEKKFRLEKYEEINEEIISIDGYTDEYSIIQALKLNIDGQTKPSSMQFARRATINEHSGSLRCSEAYINTLQNGIVNATKVSIGSSNGGDIYAQNIEIENLNENTNIICANSLKITNLNSENTTITVDYKQIPILISKLELIEEDIQHLEKKLSDAKQHNIPDISFLSKSIVRFKNEKKRIINSTQNTKIEIQNSTKETNKVVFILEDTTKTITIKKGNNIIISI